MVEIGIGLMRTNADTKKVYDASFDGTAVELFINDLRQGFGSERTAAAGFGLVDSPSKFLAGVARTYKKLDDDGVRSAKTEYANFVKALGVCERWASAMQLALCSKPQPGDYDLLKEEMALYIANKLLVWPESNTWYDNECLYTFGALQEQWGSLRLVSNEGMEAWNKKLNEILRLGNGFANAGAIPKIVKQAGQAAINSYMETRKNEMPSEPQWVFEQSLLQHHAHVSDSLAAVSELRKAGKVIAWADFSVYWLRFMVAARLRCRLRARVMRKATRPEVQRASVKRAPPGMYATLLEQHVAYWANVDEYLSASDLQPAEKARQQRILRRMRANGKPLFGGCACK